MNYSKEVSKKEINQLQLPESIRSNLLEVTKSESVSLADDQLLPLILGQITEELFVADSLGISEQLGHFPFEKIKESVHSHGTAKQRKKSMAIQLISAIRNEFYLLICAEDPKYKDLRSKFTVNFDQLVPVVAATISSSLGITAGVIIGVVAAILITLFKVPKNAWCRTLRESEK